MAFKFLRKAVLERLSIIIPPIKDEEWMLILRPKLEEKIEIQAPEDASIGGQVIAILAEFVAQVEFNIGDEPKEGDKSDLMRGVPALFKNGSEWEVWFRGQDFINYLKRRKAEEAKGAKLWSILRKQGLGHKKIRIDSSVIQVWTMAYEPHTVEFSDPVAKIKEEF